jgi:class 3 adenylate cyclase/integral membrane sensor domain MASE1
MLRHSGITALPPQPLRQYLVSLAIFVLCHLLLSGLTLLIPFPKNFYGAAFWFPAGFAVMALFLYGKQLFPGVAISSVILSLISGMGWSYALVAGLNDACQAAIGMLLLQQVRFNPRLERLRDVVGLFIFGAAIPACLSATIGVLNLAISSKISWSDGGEIWLRWWHSNVTGTFLVMLILLPLGQWWLLVRSSRIKLELAAWMLIVIGCFVTHSQPQQLYTLGYLAFPLTLWGAIRFGIPGAAFVITLFVAVVIYALGQITNPTTNFLIGLQTCTYALAISGLLVASIMTQLQQARAKADELLLKVLPSPVVDRLKQGDQIADHYAEATVMFADIVGFTPLTAQMPPLKLLAMLNEIFSAFDQLAEKYGLEKIKTIGDAYMVVGGLPEARADHAQAIADMALEMQAAVAHFSDRHQQPLTMRIGIHTGSVVAGIIGTKRFTYDLWGDTVNIASRMESQGTEGCIQVTETTYRILQAKYLLQKRGTIEVKGRGEMVTYWLLSRRRGEIERPASSQISKLPA